MRILESVSRQTLSPGLNRHAWKLFNYFFPKFNEFFYNSGVLLVSMILAKHALLKLKRLVKHA
jgi:hypothetical protein